jgi:hypothetical protein
LETEVVASSEGDPSSTLQIEKLKRTAEQVRQLRRVGKGYGVWHFDQELEGGDTIPTPVA